jgi:hypothetical protein
MPAFSASDMTAGELVAALQMAREVEEARRVPPIEPSEADPDAPVAGAETAADENVTPLSSARHTK